MGGVSTTTSTTAPCTWRKAANGEWVVYGPPSIVTAGATVTVARKGGTTSTARVASVGKPFTVGTREMVYGYIDKNTPVDDAEALPASQFPPTAEQQAAIDLFLTGESLKVTAVAGAGKTSTLKMMADRAPERRGIFTAFNKAIVTDAAAKMPRNVRCQTAHSLAWAGTPAEFKERFNRSKGQAPWMAARQLGIDSPFAVTVDMGDDVAPRRKVIAPDRLAGYVLGAVRLFCQSADDKITVKHFPYYDGIDMPDGYGRRTYANNRRLAAEFLPVAQRAWTDLCNPDGVLRYNFDHYLKQWSLARPDLGVDFVMVDEAQDMSPVMMAVIEHQIDLGHQVVMVGDSMQAINGFTGCVDALATDKIDNETALTKSWRFGPAIADAANVILERLGSLIRVEGNDTVRSVCGPVAKPDCFLARTNAGAVRRMLEELADGGLPHLVGKPDEIVSFCEAAEALQQGRSTSHPEIGWAENWAQVKEFASDDQGADIKLMVSLIDEFEARTIINALTIMPPEDQATLVCSTAHKVKGREWGTVVLGGDFPTGDDRELGPDELMLAYVAVTRAKTAVDFSALTYLAAL